MGVLKNARWERFAQELAQGKSADEAYQLAGYKANDGNCIRLKGNERVAERVAELQSKPAKKAQMTIESLIAEADEVRRAAAEANQYAAAVAALKLKSIFGGLYVEKQEAKVETTEHTIERAPTANDWQAKHAEEEGSRLAPAERPPARTH